VSETKGLEWKVNGRRNKPRVLHKAKPRIFIFRPEVAIVQFSLLNKYMTLYVGTTFPLFNKGFFTVMFYNMYLSVPDRQTHWAKVPALARFRDHTQTRHTQ